MSAKPKPLSEAHIQQTCTQMLELDGWRSLRTSPVSNRARATGFGELGMADYLYIRYSLRDFGDRSPVWASVAQVMWIEWKAAKGKAAPHQAAWIDVERARGALVLLAGVDFPASIEGFRNWYKTSRLMRRKILS